MRDLDRRSVDELRRSLEGDALEPIDDGYDAARRCFNALVDRRPAAIARCVNARDVATALDFARAQRLDVAVRGGGHNPAGHCAIDGGLVVDLTRMRRVDTDSDARRARAQGGATWLDFDASTQGAGLATPGGVVGSTGVAGLTFGGGIGYLTAQHGLTCDNLVGAELVTPEGSVVEADAELLWGLRGGGGNFGVATQLDFRLYPVERLVGGILRYAGTGVRDALRVFRDVVARAPRELGCQGQIGIDASLQPTLDVLPSYTGSSGDPEGLRALRGAPGLLADEIREQSFLDQQGMVDPAYGAYRHYWKGHFVRELPDELIDVLLARLAELDRPGSHVLIESLHGAPKDADPALGALRFRDAAFNVSAMAVWESPADDQRFIAWGRETAAAIEPWSLGGGYANYAAPDEPLDRVRAAFGAEAFERLQALKRTYDPTNVLRRNANIPPTIEG